MANVKQNSNIRHIFSNTPKDPDILHSHVQRYYTDRLEKKWKNIHPMKGLTPSPQSIILRTNDYLCLAGDKRVIDAEITALRNFGHGDSVSRVWTYQQKDSLNAFEQRAAKLMKCEATVLCPSGYTANVGLIQSIAKPETPIYLDMFAHMSLWEGAVSAKAVAHPFRHNDANHLEKLIKKHGPGFIGVDALYSTNGELCPLKDILDVCERYDCALIVDETHSFGAQGKDGAGLVVELGLADRVHFRTAGLSKAVSSRGGIIACSQRNAEFLRLEAFPAIFSTSVLQHEVAGYNAVLDIFKSDPWRQRRLHQNHKYLRDGLDAIGYNVDKCHSQIISLEAGEILKTISLRNILEARDIFGAIFFAPAVPEKRCLVRLTVNCNLTMCDLDYILQVCEEIRDDVKLHEWKSTKRKQKSKPANMIKTTAA